MQINLHLKPIPSLISTEILLRFPSYFRTCVIELDFFLFWYFIRPYFRMAVLRGRTIATYEIKQREDSQGVDILLNKDRFYLLHI